MTGAFHEQGIKVYIDVVYNHTGEGSVSNDGKTARLLSFRGLDNGAYYEVSDDLRFYYDNNGVGPNLNAAHPRVRQLAVDSLAYWKDVLGVDGYRFDLASVLGNTCLAGCFSFNKFEPQNILNRAVKELPARPAEGGDGVDLIAEPWGIGDGTYQVGQFPHGWAEWNDKYRDTFRIAQNRLGITHVPPAELARRFSGSSDCSRTTGENLGILSTSSSPTTVSRCGICTPTTTGTTTSPGPSDPPRVARPTTTPGTRGQIRLLQRQACA